MKGLPRSNFMAALAGVALTLYAQVSAAPFASPDLAGAAASQYVPGEVLVKFNPEAIAQERAASVAARGHTVLAHLEQPGWVHVKLGTGQSVTEALVVYQNDPNVEYAQPNYIYRAAAAPNDTRYGQLWAFKNTGQTVTAGTFLPKTGTAGDDMNIERAWNHITDCSSVVVAVVDSGVNYTQEDLAANMWNGGPGFPKHGHDFVDNDDDPMDLLGHGTHVAGIVGAAGDNAMGTAGVCWKASIMAVRVLDATGSGTTAGIVQGVNFAVSNGAKVINMSLSGGGAFDQIFSNAVTTAQSGDVVVVVAAGNENSNNDAVPVYPCSFTQPNLVCVAALDQNFVLASFSNFGATSVDVGAPGTNILSSFAGVVATTPDLLTTAWTISNGWIHARNGVNDSLVDPATFPVAKYGPNLNDTAIKGFPVSAVDVVILNFSAAVNLADGGDSFVVGVDPNGVDPFGTGALQDGIAGPVHTLGAAIPISLDISGCAGKPNCLIGFKLVTGPSTPRDFGIGIAHFSIDTLTITTNTYQIESGTSMASPEVAGLAAMLRAFNPQYTYADTVGAIKNGGRSVPALAGKTTSGKAVDVMSSLAFINPPTGLTVTVQ